MDEDNGADFIARGFARLDQLTDRFHDLVLRRVIIAGRTVAYGLIAVATLLVAVVVGLIALDRFLNVYAFGNRAWASDLALGALFVLAGGVTWRWRRPVDRRP